MSSQSRASVVRLQIWNCIRAGTELRKNSISLTLPNPTDLWNFFPQLGIILEILRKSTSPYIRNARFVLHPVHNLAFMYLHISRSEYQIVNSLPRRHNYIRGVYIRNMWLSCKSNDVRGYLVGTTYYIWKF